MSSRVGQSLLAIGQNISNNANNTTTECTCLTFSRQKENRAGTISVHQKEEHMESSITEF